MNEFILQKIFFLIILLFCLVNNLNKYKNFSNYIYNDINNNITIKNIINLKKLVYTIILGSYDKPKQFNKQEGYDYYLITDDNSIEKYKETNWTILKIPDEVTILNISTVKKQRFLKLHPHLFFKNYDLSIYIDGTFIITGNLTEFLLRILTPQIYFYTFEHPQRNRIFQELKAVIKYKKENRRMTKLIQKRYKKKKFPDNNGLIESCLLIRKHNEKGCINFMNRWYYEIRKYSHRDQLSFNYIYWKNNIKIKYISKQYALEYFFQNRSHLFKKIY